MLAHFSGIKKVVHFSQKLFLY